MTTRYCGVKEAKRFARIINYANLGFATEDEYEDHIEDLVEMSSRHIDDFCKRPEDFFKGGATVTEYHNGLAYQDASYPSYPPDLIGSNREKRRTFYLRQYPIISITTVKENNALIGDADDWEDKTAYRVNNTTGILKFSSGTIPREGYDNIEFVYVAGYATTPKVIQWVVAELVGNWLKEAFGDRSTQHINMERPSSIEFENPKIFTDEMKDRLSKYVKRR